MTITPFIPSHHLRKTMAKRIQVRLPSHTDYLDLIRDFVSRLARESGFDEENIYKISLAVDEACTNVIRHAYGPKGHNFVEVEVEADDIRFTVIVADSGKGFDASLIREPDIKVNMARHKFGGFGLYLMKTLMDEVTFSMNPGVRNEVRLTKYKTTENSENRDTS